MLDGRYKASHSKVDCAKILFPILSTWHWLWCDCSLNFRKLYLDLISRRSASHRVQSINRHQLIHFKWSRAMRSELWISEILRDKFTQSDSQMKQWPIDRISSQQQQHPKSKTQRNDHCLELELTTSFSLRWASEMKVKKERIENSHEGSGSPLI